MVRQGRWRRASGRGDQAANFEGTHANGGALLLCGDDHAAKSSLTAHQSEHVLVTAMAPFSATTDEILTMGQLGWALSRASGLYVGVKAVTDTLDLTTTVSLPEANFPIVSPELGGRPSPNLRIGMSALQQEQAVIEQRLPIVPLFASANRIDRVSHDARERRLTVVTAGKAWLDVCQALADLGLDDAACRSIGLRVVKLGESGRSTPVSPATPSAAAARCWWSRKSAPSSRNSLPASSTVMPMPRC